MKRLHFIFAMLFCVTYLSGCSTSHDAITVPLPHDASPPAVAATVEIASDGSVSVRERPTALDELSGALLSAGVATDSHIVIRAREDTRHSAVVAVVGELKKAGFVSLSFATLK